MFNNANFAQWVDGFWLQHERFLKALLPTEAPHPKTTLLATWAQQDLAQGLSALNAVDLAMLDALEAYVPDMLSLRQAIQEALNRGGKVYIAGCGATGRMAVSLALFWRRQFPHLAGRVIAVIAGGDTAVIHSIEKFEDHASLGARQLEEAGFGPQDLLLSASAGGESPFVLGAVQYALTQQTRPWLIYCNPDSVLLARNPAHPLADARVRALSIYVGPMALTGSTRMQATTALMLAIGLPLLCHSEDEIPQHFGLFKQHLAGMDYHQLIPFIAYEAAVYQRAEYMLYNTAPDCAMTVLTDTTERAPTFNLAAFDSAHSQATASWVYLCLPMAHDARKAWELLLSRKPKALNWPEFSVTDSAYLYGFDFSQQVKVWRTEKLGTQPQHALNIYPYQQGFVWQLGPHKTQFGYGHLPLLLQQLALKVLLNNHSTLVFGRLGFYEGNLMTSLSPSNYKLLDRAIRYVGYLWQQQGGAALNYHQLADCVLAELPGLLPAESIVHKALRRLG